MVNEGFSCVFSSLFISVCSLIISYVFYFFEFNSFVNYEYEYLELYAITWLTKLHKNKAKKLISINMEPRLN